jgi:ATP-binding protein involved in chromosome partitioning
MIIAIPLVGGVLSEHFGHCEEFAFLEIDETAKKVVKESRQVPPEHEPGVLPRWLIANKATVAIVGGMGMRAREMLEQAGVKVIMGAPSLPPADLARDFLAGRLTDGENTCDHGPDHTCQGHGQDQGHPHPGHHPKGKK